jgi:hypothetical protein
MVRARAYGSPLSFEGEGEGYSEQVRRVAAKTPRLSPLPLQRARQDNQSAALIDVEGSRARLV